MRKIFNHVFQPCFKKKATEGANLKVKIDKIDTPMKNDFFSKRKKERKKQVISAQKPEKTSLRKPEIVKFELDFKLFTLIEKHKNS